MDEAPPVNAPDDPVAIVMATLLVSCRDRTGLVAALSDFVFRNEGNIIDADQHADRETGLFFMRLVWALAQFRLPRERIGAAVAEIAQRFELSWELTFSDVRPRVAILASTLPHCLYDLLLSHQLGELGGDLALVISNHDLLAPVAGHFGIPFQRVAVEAGRKDAAEAEQQRLLTEYRVDVVVLARSMQILSPAFVARWPGRIVNIHHSFLPAFVGARPYHQAQERGVKVIGATAPATGQSSSGDALAELHARRLQQRDHRAAHLVGRRYFIGKIEAQAIRGGLDVEAERVHAHHAGAGGVLAGGAAVSGQRVGVVAVHVRADVGGVGAQRVLVGIAADHRARQPRDAPEPGDEAQLLDLQLPQLKIVGAEIAARLRVPRQVAGAGVGDVALGHARGAPQQRHAPAGLRVIRRRAVAHEQTGARVGQQILGVRGQRADEDDGLAGSRRGVRRHRAVWISGPVDREGGQHAGALAGQQAAGRVGQIVGGFSVGRVCAHRVGGLILPSEVRGTRALNFAARPVLCCWIL